VSPATCSRPCLPTHQGGAALPLLDAPPIPPHLPPGGSEDETSLVSLEDLLSDEADAWSDSDDGLGGGASLARRLQVGEKEAALVCSKDMQHCASLPPTHC
jgi:hypothetical protein